MSYSAIVDVAVVWPVARIGRILLSALAYVGSLTLLATSAAGSAFRRSTQGPPMVTGVLREAGALASIALPVIALLHVGLGSFLSMQAYFGGTFVDGTGAVVGVGLIRNVAPLMTGLALALLVAARTTPELRLVVGRLGADDGPGARASGRSRGSAGPSPIDPAREAGVRIGAAMLVAPGLALTAVIVGTVVGWLVAQRALGVSTETFFSMFFDMLWERDVLGLAVKSTVFAFLAGLFACHEGLRPEPCGDMRTLQWSACRAACLAASAMLAINSGWFMVLYHTGPGFGPTLMAPPGQ